MSILCFSGNDVRCKVFFFFYTLTAFVPHQDRYLAQRLKSVFGQKLLLPYPFGALAAGLEFQRFGVSLPIVPGEVVGCHFSLS